MKIGELILQLVVQGKDAAAELRKYDSAQKQTEAGTRRLDASTKAFSATLKKMTFAVGGIYGAYRLLTTTIKSAITRSNAQEEAEARLTAALRNHGQATEENIARLKRLAAERQRVTKFGDEETISALAMLATFDLQVKDLERLIPRMQDVATMTNKTTGEQIGLENAAKLVGLAMESQAGRLKQAGISVRKYEDELKAATTDSEKMAIVLKILDENAAGMAEAVGTTDSAALRQMTNAIGDNLEKLGAWIKRGLGPAARLITGMISGIEKESDQLRKQRAELNLNAGVLKSYYEQEKLSNYELKNRNELFEKLRKQYPGYFKDIDLEKAKYEDIAAAIEKINDNLVKKIRIKVYEEEIEALARQQMEIEKADEKLRKENEEYLTAQKKAMAEGYDFETIQRYTYWIDVNKKKLEENRLEYENLGSEIIKLQKKINDTEFIEPPPPPDTGEQSEIVELTEAEAKAQFEINRILAERAGIAQEIKFWENEKAKLNADDLEQRLQILMIEQKIETLKKRQADEANKQAEKDIKAQAEIDLLLARRADSQKEINDRAREIAYWEERLKTLTGDSKEVQLEKVQIEDRILELKKEQAAAQAEFNEMEKAAIDLANQLSGRFADALVTQWQQGKSAIKAWGDAVSQMIQQIAAEIIAKAAVWALFGVVTGGSGAGAGKFIFSGNLASLGTLLGFDSGGYSGDGDPSKVAGVVHKRELVFESRITQNNLPDLLALRSALQKGYTVRQLMQPQAIIIQGPDYDFQRLEKRLDVIAEKVNQRPAVTINSNLDALKFYEEDLLPAQKTHERKIS